MKLFRQLILSITMLTAFNAAAQCTCESIQIIYNDPTCDQFCDGSVSVNTTCGGVNDVITIEDSLGNAVNVGGANTANSLCEGWYYVTVDFTSGCTLIDSVLLVDPGPITIDYTIGDALCDSEPTGWITIDTVYNYTGAFNQISYFWNPDPSSQSGIGGDSTFALVNGNYTVNINDENGCSAVFDFVVSAPPPLVFTVFTGDDCVNGNDGVVAMAAGGGTPDYVYVWTRLSDMAQGGFTTWGGQNADCFEGHITDLNGCVLKDTICIGCVGLEEFESSVVVYPNPVQNQLHIELEVSANIELLDVSGKLVLSQYAMGNTQLDVSSLEAGIYILSIEIEGVRKFARVVKE